TRRVRAAPALGLPRPSARLRTASRQGTAARSDRTFRDSRAVFHGSPNYHTLALLRGLGYLLFRKNRVRSEKVTEFEGRRSCCSSFNRSQCQGPTTPGPTIL